MQTMYVKVPSGTSLLKVQNSQRVTRWGKCDYDNGWAGYVDGFYSYGDDFPKISGRLSKTTFPNLVDCTLYDYEFAHCVDISFDLADMPRGLQEFEIASYEGLGTGVLADMPRVMKYIYMMCDNSIGGSYKDLPATMIYFWFWSYVGNIGSVTYGEASDISDNIIKFATNGEDCLSGDFKDVGRNLFYLGLGSLHDTIGGDLADLPAPIAQFSYYGVGAITYTGGRVWNDAINWIKIKPAVYGLSREEMIDLLIDFSSAAWSYGRDYCSCYIRGECASLADTSQGGIWGDYSGTPAPSALAIALKDLNVKAELTIQGITIPGATGDGVGFPSGFGNWWRS